MPQDVEDKVEMSEPAVKPPLVKRRGPPDFSDFKPPPPPARRPPGPLKLGPGYRVPTETTQTIQFRFRTRVLHATASPIHHLHQNVLRLRLQPSIIQQVLQALARYLPSSMQSWFASSFPEWNLPSQLILKTQKEGWDEEFETEKAAYAKLQPLQGTIIPECFGELSFNNTRALLLSDIGGACLAEPDGSLLEVPELRRLLHQALTALSQFRILQDDIKLDNFHLVGDRIMIVDLETLGGESWSDEQLAPSIDYTVKWLAGFYEDNQYCFWEDGLIAIDD